MSRGLAGFIAGAAGEAQQIGREQAAAAEHDRRRKIEELRQANLERIRQQYRSEEKAEEREWRSTERAEDREYSEAQRQEDRKYQESQKASDRKYAESQQESRDFRSDIRDERDHEQALELSSRVADRKLPNREKFISDWVEDDKKRHEAANKKPSGGLAGLGINLPGESGSDALEPFDPQKSASDANRAFDAIMKQQGGSSSESPAESLLTEGQVIRNPNTGEMMVVRNGQLVPYANTP